MFYDPGIERTMHFLSELGDMCCYIGVVWKGGRLRGQNIYIVTKVSIRKDSLR